MVNAKQEAEIELRREAAIALRVRGWTYEAIGKELGISRGQAYKDVRAVIQESIENRQEDAEQVLAVELRRLDAATDVCIKTIVDGVGAEDAASSLEMQLKAIDRLVKINDQRSKMLGLYAPQKVEQAIIGEVSPDKIRDVVRARFGNVAPEVTDEPEAADTTDG